jgi:hypothetical protein
MATTVDELLARYVKETHPWIDTDSAFFIALSQAVRTQLSQILTDVEALPDWQRSGTPLLRVAESWKLFLSGSQSNHDILTLLEQIFAIHSRRGSVPGIAFDTETLLNYPPNLYYLDSLEWYLGITFPGQKEYIGPGALPDGAGHTCLEETTKIGLYNILCLGIDTAIIVQYFNDTGRTDAEVEGIVLQEFVPPRVAVDFQPFTYPPAPLLMFEQELGMFQ